MTTDVALRVTMRAATVADAAALAALNAALIVDEGHRNRMTRAALEARLAGWLSTDYRGVVAIRSDAIVADAIVGYALGCPGEYDTLRLRQLYVVDDARRGGIGRRLVEAFAATAPSLRMRVDVLVRNAPGLAFWHSMGFVDYALALERPGAGATTALLTADPGR